ncbi:MAG: hypothetical protein KC503_31080, partial [Myxococcales bacterium]|nr:hypothetical protein [Myxococcales bacterium]
ATGPSPFAAGAPPGPPPASGGNPWGATPVQPQQAQAQPQPQPQQHQAPPPTNIHPQAGQPGQPPLGAPPPTNIHGAPYAAGAAIAPTAISGGAAGYTPQGYGAPAPAYPQQQPAPAATGAPRAGGKKKKGKGGVIALIAILSVVGLSALVGGIYFATRGGGGGDGDPDGDGTAGGSSGGGGAGAAAASTLRLVTPASDMLLLTFPKRIESLQPGTLSAPLVGPLGPMLKASGAKVSDFDELLVLVPKMPTAMFSAGGTAETAIAMRGLDSDAVTKKLAAEAGVTKSKVSGVTVYSQAVYSAAAVDKRTVVFGMNKPVRAMLERVGADAPAKDATPNMQRVIDGQALIYAFLRLPPSLTQQLQRNLDLEEPLKISSLTLGASEKGGAVQVRVLLAMGDAAKAKALQPLLSEQLTCRHLPAFCAVVDKLKLSVDGGDLLGSVALDKAQMSALLQALRRVGGGSGVGGFGGAGGGGNGLLPNPYRRNNPYRPPSGAGGGGGQTLPDTTL